MNNILKRPLMNYSLSNFNRSPQGFSNFILRKPVSNFAVTGTTQSQNDTINKFKKEAIPIGGGQNKTDTSGPKAGRKKTVIKPISEKKVESFVKKNQDNIVKIDKNNTSGNLASLNDKISSGQKDAQPINTILRKPENPSVSNPTTTASDEQKNRENAQNFLKGKTGGSSTDNNNQAQNTNATVNSVEDMNDAYASYKQEANNQDQNTNNQPQNQQPEGEEKGIIDSIRDSEAVKTGSKYLMGTVDSEREASINSGKELAKKENEKYANKMEKDIGGGTFEQSLTQEKLEQKQNEINALQMEIDRNVKNGWGIQKYAALGGAVFGAISKYKKDLERWEYECQRAAAEGRPMPKKPSLAGAMIAGGLGGGAAGFMAGGVLKHVGPVKNLDRNLKTAGYNKNLQRFNEQKGYNAVEKVNSWTNLTENAKRGIVNKEINSNISKGAAAIKKYATTLKKGGQLTSTQVDYMKELQRTKEGIEILKKSFPGQNIQKVIDDARYNATAFFSNVGYVAICFSYMEDLRADTEEKIEEYKELYNFYTLHMNEEAMDIKTFLKECCDYPAFAEYIKESMSEFVEDELITFAEMYSDNLSDVIANYKSLYKDYQDVVGTNLDPQEFIERCIKYPSYTDYIYSKVKRTKLLKLGLQSFAELNSTSLPQNVQINGQNVDTTQERLPDAKDAETMNNQNSLQSKEQQAKSRQEQLQRQKQEQQRQQQIEANKANYAKAMGAKEQDKINKLSQQKAAIAKNLGRNASDMQTGQLAQEKQKITNLNLKIQQVKADTKNKIANYKGTGKQFSFVLRKP